MTATWETGPTIIAWRTADPATLPLWQHPDTPRSTSGSRLAIAAKPSRTSYSRSRRRWTAWLDGRGDLRDEGISGTKDRDKWPVLVLDALLKSGRFGTPSYKRPFLRDLLIGSDCVLKPAMQRPRTYSRNPRPDCSGVWRVL